MKIRKNIIWCVTWIVLLLQLDILGGVIPFLDDSIAWKIEMLLVLFDSIYAILILSKNGLLSKYKALNAYIIIYTACLFGISSIRNFGINNAEIIYSMIIYLLITGVSLSFLDIARIDVVPFLLLFLQTWKWDGDNLEELGYDG